MENVHKTKTALVTMTLAYFFENKLVGEKNRTDIGLHYRYVYIVN